MKDFATKYIKWYDALPLWAKVLCCFLWAVPSNLYRFSKSALAENTVGMVLAIVICILGGWLFLLIDIFSLLIKGKILWLDDINEIIATDEKPAEESATEEAPAEETTVEDAPVEEPAETTDAE